MSKHERASTPTNFEQRWSNELLDALRTQRERVAKNLAKLKPHDTPYRRAHVLILELYDVALTAIDIHLIAQECTGVAANWCPRCGDCTCPEDPDGRVIRDRQDADCPLHGERSTHADPSARVVV